MSFERPNIHQAEQDQEEQTLDLILEYEKTHRRLDRLDEQDFSDIYPEDEIKADKDKIRTKRAKKERSASADGDNRETLNRKKGEAFEVVAAEGVGNFYWLGESAYLVRTAEYDDIENKTDAVMEFELDESAERMALAIDVYGGSDIGNWKKKIEGNLRKIAGGGRQVVKYFEGQVPDQGSGEVFRGELKDVVPAVFGLSGRRVENLFAEFQSYITAVQNIELRKSSGLPGSAREAQELKNIQRKIENHEASIIFLEELFIQLEGYLKLAKEGKTSEHIAEQIKNLYNIVKDIRKERFKGQEQKTLEKTIEQEHLISEMKTLL